MIAISGINAPIKAKNKRSGDISPHAQISSQARIGAGVSVGAFSVIGPHVVIGDGVIIHEHVIIKGQTVIADDAEILPFATIGLPSQDKKCRRDFEGEVHIGASTIIREHTSIHAPTDQNGATKIGANTLIMGQCHVAHDCVIGDHVVISQGVKMSGHVTIADHAIIGGGTGMHQHARVGKYAMVGGLCRVVRDVLPFALMDGIFAEIRGVNLVGLKRHGFSNEQCFAIKRAFTILLSKKLQQAEAIKILHESTDDNVAEIIKFALSSTRGLMPLSDDA